jgi:hypothetical protein
MRWARHPQVGKTNKPTVEQVIEAVIPAKAKHHRRIFARAKKKHRNETATVF